MRKRRTSFPVIVLVSALLVSASFSSIAPANAGFSLSQVLYYDRVKNALSLTPEQETALAANGFISVNISLAETEDLKPSLRFEDFYWAFVYHNDLPVFVTTDSILHLFHVVFDCALKNLENDTLYPMLLNITQYAYDTALADYNSINHTDLPKYWAVRNSTVYFAVALSLLTNETLSTLPAELSEDVTFFTNETCAKEPKLRYVGAWLMPGFPDVTVGYDFTQFTVRGHYLGDPRLERYFRTLMWFGQFPVFIPRNDEQYIWWAPHIDDTASIVHIRDILKSSPEHYEEWLRLFNITSTLIGGSDSVGLLNLETALQNVFGNADKYLDYVLTTDGLESFRDELSKPEYQQQILSQALLVGAVGYVLPRYPIVFQFMGQRYVPDSYIFQLLCWDKVGYNHNMERRIMPKGIDVFAVLGSERADQLLIPDHVFEDFTDNLASLKGKFGNQTEEEREQSSYTTWVYALQNLVETQPMNDYPEFMRTLAWQDEKLNTALGSWAQLRHDTILYAKQTYIPAYVCSYPEAFAEPYPEFYSRMQKLAQKTIDAVNLLNPANVNPTITGCLQTIINVTKQLETISTKELAKEPLTEDEVTFLKQIAWQCGSGGFIGWYVDTIHAIAKASHSESTLETPVIADVATFPPDDIEYPPQILHAGTGYVNALVVLYPMANGTLVAAVGPVFTYYEFRLIGTKRLNDDEWKKMLTWDNRSAYLPEWLKDVYGLGEPLPADEYPVTSTILILTTLTAISTATVKLRRKREVKKIQTKG